MPAEVCAASFGVYECQPASSIARTAVAQSTPPCCARPSAVAASAGASARSRRLSGSPVPRRGSSRDDRPATPPPVRRPAAWRAGPPTATVPDIRLPSRPIRTRTGRVGNDRNRGLCQETARPARSSACRSRRRRESAKHRPHTRQRRRQQVDRDAGIGSRHGERPQLRQRRNVHIQHQWRLQLSARVGW